MRWDWETFPQFLDSLERQGLGINVGAMFPFSPMRGYVLGMMPARERTSVTEAELNQMKQLLREAMKAGAFGFSLNKNMEDRPEDGGFLPSHVASDEEFYALAQVLGEFGVGHVGLVLMASASRLEQRPGRAHLDDGNPEDQRTAPPRQGDHEPGAGPLQDERPSRLAYGL